MNGKKLSMISKQLVADYLKNIKGWKTKSKIIIFTVDDYGNIRLSNETARKNLLKNGIELKGIFDNFDVLDNREDFEQLFKVLASVKDKNGNPAIITTYAVPCNVNFHETLKYGKYIPENLDETYARLSVSDPEHYEGAFELLKYGIRNNLLRPQFHGREHLNINIINAYLAEKHPIILANLQANSLVGLPQHKLYPNVSFTEAFGFWDNNDIELHKSIIQDGLIRFRKVYGIEPKTFTPPGMKLHPELYPFLEKLGIVAIDKPRVALQHLGFGKYIKERNITGIKASQNHVTIVRNCLFEPNSRDIDWVEFTINQIRAAFFWNKPAIISSHRVNYCGQIDPNNRVKGLSALDTLLKRIVKIWPDVEFMAIDDLAMEIINSIK